MYKVNISENLNKILTEHLIRIDGQEDLCFALYNFSTGKHNQNAIIKDIILPEEGDRNVHGNVSFNHVYFDKVSAIALEQKCGICFLHSHPSNGWQWMSYDDIKTEEMLAPRCKALTGLPLIGMTVSEDSVWSARFWIKTKPKFYKREFCYRVSVLGKGLDLSYYDILSPKFNFGIEFLRTISAWGDEKQNKLSRLKIGIVGLGSVGSIIAEALIKTGIQNISLIDFDLVEPKNLDRLQGVGKDAIGRHKIFAIRDHLLRISPRPDIDIQTFPFSIVEKEGLQAALDCDILFSCVDRPWARFILNSISYANYIPVIDGGIDTNQNKKRNNIDQARWKAHTIGPDRICLSCLSQFLPEDVSLEMSGLLEDQHYVKGLPNDHFTKRGENVFAFSLGLASMEIQQFLSLNLQPRGLYYGPKEFDFNSGNIDYDFNDQCKSNCDYLKIIGEGDKINSTLISSHPIAILKRDIANKEIKPKNKSLVFEWLYRLKKLSFDFLSI